MTPSNIKRSLPKKTSEPLRVDRPNRATPHIRPKSTASPLPPKPVAASPPKQAKTHPARLLLLVVLGLAPAMGLTARTWLASWTRARLEGNLAGQLAALPEQDAAQLLREIDPNDERAVTVLVRALADARPAVGDAARQAIERLLTGWQRLPPAAAIPHLSTFARELAAQAERIPASRRPLAQDLAARLLVWPLDARTPGADELIAHCEAVLRLPPLTEAEVRVATATPRSDARKAEDPVPVVAEDGPTSPPPANSDEAPMASPEPAVLQFAPPSPVPPDPLPGASSESPLEPRRFLAPRAERIER
jgi:hypothetical protein